MDDVTCLTFHSIKRDILASGSTDGLMNIFDLAQPAEDLALMYSLNTGSSVVRLSVSDEKYILQKFFSNLTSFCYPFIYFFSYIQ